MAERCLLHKNKLYMFERWLSSKGYEIQDTKSVSEVLRATKDKETVVIFQKNNAKEHFTVQQKDYLLVRQFIKQAKNKAYFWKMVGEG